MENPKILRYFFHIGYSGTNFSGWQKHRGVETVQQTIEQSLTKIFKCPIAIVGCGRTDALVHALQFFFHVDIDQPIDFDLAFRLNKTLPADIAVFDIIAMEGLPHCRFDAIQRKYDYFIHTFKDPFLNNLSSLYTGKILDIELMMKAAKLLPKYSDYAGFCKSPDKNEHTICHVSFAEINSNVEKTRIHFQISSNRFLGKMIRILMGKLLKIGEGELSVEVFEECLQGNKISLQLEPAHPQGLFLSKVTYPYLDLPARPEFLKAMVNYDRAFL